MFVMVSVGVVIVRVSEHDSSPVHPHAIGKLTFTLILFCFASLALSLGIVVAEITGSLLWCLVTVNVGTALAVFYSYNSALDTSPLSHSLLQDEITITTVTPRRKRDVFLCPLVPTLPLIATWVDIFMMASLGWASLCGLVGLLVSGLVVYFSYGIYNSKLNHQFIRAQKCS